VTLYQDDLILGGGWIDHGFDTPEPEEFPW
jgi:hypothetical protein